MISLRPYQVDAVDRIRDSIRGGNKRICVCLPTGGGKTILAAHVAQQTIEGGKRVLFLAHRRELIRQPFCRFVGAGIEPDRIGIILAGVQSGPSTMFPAATDAEMWDGYARRRPPAPVQIASIQTLSRRKAPPADLIVIDEAHRTLSKSYVDLLEQYPNAIVLGLTATPRRSDKRGLGEVYQDMVVVAQYRDLVASGSLVEPRVWTVPRLPDLSNVRTKGEDYDPTQLDAAVNKSELIGDLVSHWQQHGNGAPTFAFAVSVAHSKRIAEAFVNAGIAAAHVDGETPTAQRDDTFARLASGDLQVVSGCDVFTEGVDVPCVKTVILARPTKSLRIYLQAVGRGSRPHENGHPFVVLDHSGCALEHGLPQEDRQWSLDPPKRRRPGVAPTKTCPQCYAVLPAACPVCPECGFEFPPAEKSELQQKDGALVEITPEARWDLVVAEWMRKNARLEVPMKPGWCYVRYKEKFGCAPPAGSVAPPLTPEQSMARAEWRARGGNIRAHAVMRRLSKQEAASHG